VTIIFRIVTRDLKNQRTSRIISLNNEPLLTDAVYEMGDKPLRDVVESLGGWPVLDDDWASKHAANWSLEAVLGRLRGVHNTPLLVETFVAADDKNSSLNVIQVSA